MKFVYLVFVYEPKHKYDGFIYEGRYKSVPFVFENYLDAFNFKYSYKHASFIRKVKLR